MSSIQKITFPIDTPNLPEWIVGFGVLEDGTEFLDVDPTLAVYNGSSIIIPDVGEIPVVDGVPLENISRLRLLKDSDGWILEITNV
jgi:hypothetical protein